VNKLELRIKQKEENQMIGRTELKFELVYEQAPPTRIQIREMLAKELNANPNLIVVRKMHNVFGMRKNIGTVHVYPDEATFKKYVSKYVLVRMGLMTKEQAKPVKTTVPAKK